MVRECLIQAVSFKVRKAKIDGQWIEADKCFDLKDLRIGKIYPLEMYQRLDGAFIIRDIVKGQ